MSCRSGYIKQLTLYLVEKGYGYCKVGMKTTVRPEYVTLIGDIDRSHQIKDTMLNKFKFAKNFVVCKYFLMYQIHRQFLVS